MACLLIDGNNIFSKYYYANKEKCIDFCISFIKNSIRLFKVTHCCCVFDAKESYRKSLYQLYKSSRKTKPEDLDLYFENFKKTLSENNLCYISSKTLEAEDSINLIVGTNPNIEFIVLSEDKDILLLRNFENCKIFKKYNEELQIPQYCKLVFSDPLFIEKYKLFFSLYGDSTDDIPGVEGFGPKKSNFIVEKIKTYDNLKNILLLEDFSFLKEDTDLYSIDRCLKVIKNFEEELDISYKLFSLFSIPQNFKYQINRFALVD